jgi:hypothetical protein
MAVLDLTEAVDRVRLACADTVDVYILPDEVIQYSLDSNNGNENLATKQCAGWILGALSHKTQVALDRIVIHGQSQFDNYLRFLKEVIRNPNNTATGFGGIYVGGVSVSDALANNSDATLVQRRLPIGYEQEGEYAIYEQPSGF